MNKCPCERVTWAGHPLGPEHSSWLPHPPVQLCVRACRAALQWKTRTWWQPPQSGHICKQWWKRKLYSEVSFKKTYTGSKWSCWGPYNCVPVCAQSCLPHCNCMDCTSQGSSVHEVFQVRILEWAAIASSRDLPDPGIELMSLRFPALAGRFFATSTTWEALLIGYTPI